jgi:hypothetical protein
MITPGKYRGEHCILVAPEWYDGAGSEMDARSYVRSLAESHVTALQVYIKDHHGIAYYDTKIGRRSSYMKGDLLAELLQEAKAHDIQLLAYYSIGWDNWVAERNPEWVMRSPQGEPIKVGFWTYLCYNTPYREYMLAQLHEIAQYQVDGLWLDILRYPQMGFHACFCDGCRAKFLASGEASMPETISFQDPAYRRYVRFLQHTVTSFLEEIRLAVGATPFTFNGIGFLTPAEWNDRCDWLNVESHAPEHTDQSFKSRYLAGLRRPWEILTPGTAVGWTSWTAKPPDTMKLELAITASHGGTATFGSNPPIGGDTQRADSTMAAQRTAFGEAYGWFKERLPWLGDRPHRLGNVAILQSISTEVSLFGGHANPGLDQDVFRSTKLGEPLEAYPREVILDSLGFHGSLLPTDTQYEIINEYSIDRLADFDLVILPDQRCLTQLVADKLRAFVSRGGNLIATHRSSLYDEDGAMLRNFTLSDLFGVDYLDLSHFDVHYIDMAGRPLSAGLHESVTPARQPAVKVKTHAGAEILATLRWPDSKRTQSRFYFHEASGPDHRTPALYPAITSNSYGQGRAIYLAVPIGREYFVYKSYTASQLIRTLTAQASRPVATSSHPRRVEMTLVRQAESGRLVIHLVNHYTDEIEPFRESDSVERLRISWDREYLEACKGSPWQKVYLAPNGAPLEVSERNGRCEIEISRLDIHAMVVFE